MKRISLIGRIRHFVNILIVMQGILLALLTIFFLDQRYIETWRNYQSSNESITIYLRDIPTDENQSIENYFYEMANKERLFIVRRDSLLENDGEFGGYKFGVCGIPSNTTSELSFMGQKIVNVSQIEQLLSSKNTESTLGMDEGSIHMIADIPGFRFGDKIVIKQLTQIVNESGTINGVYTVSGDSASTNNFLNGLTNIVELTQDELLTPMSGEIQDNSFTRDILIVLLFVQIVLNSVALLVIAVRNLDKQGKLALLGWSKAAFTHGIFGDNFLFTIICIPILIIAGYLISGWNQISGILFSFFAFSAFINVLITALEMAIASIVIVLTKSIDAISGRIPQKALYILGVFGYLIFSVGITFCGSYVDQPIQYLTENAKLAKQWNRVADYEILSDISVGEDADSFTGRSKQLDEDIYNWYSDIAGEEGVYLINTTYYDNDVLTLWKQNNLYKSIPDKPFWYFAVSPNYLEMLGIHVPDDLIQKAEKGTRVYLFPENMSETNRSQIEGWFKESTTKNLSDGDIQTQFTKHPQFEYSTYEIDTDFFTWATTSEHSAVTKEPVIYIATPQNMRYFETESLRASGFEGYIKFSDVATMVKYTDQSIFAQYNLSDNEITFSKVSNYIDGLQKELWLTMSWFGLVFLVLLIILIGLLIILATIFRIANQEKINVKKFLGFNFWQIYRGPIIFLTGVGGIELLTMLILQSKFGFMLMVLVLLLQALIFIKYMSRNELERVLLAFKGD